MKKLLIWLTAVLAAVTMTACGEKDEPTPGEYELTVSPKSMNLIVGESQRLSVDLTPAVDGVEYQYESSDKSVASVNQKGVVTACAEGDARITVTCRIGKQEVSAKCRVTVSAVSLSIDPAEVVMLAGHEKQLHVVSNISIDDSAVQWSTSDASIASVRGGIVDACALGNCTITASINGAEAHCLVRVVEPGVYVIPEQLSLIAGDTADITIVVLGLDNTDYSVTNQDPTVAFFDEEHGKMVAVEPGQTSVSFSNGSSSSSCSIEVEALTVSAPKKLLFLGDQVQLTCNAAHVRWWAEDDTILTVDANGLATCVGEGSTRIFAYNGAKRAAYAFKCYLEHDYSFSVSKTKKVFIAPGNLQYHPASQTWRFASEQYEMLTASNHAFDGSATYNDWIDQFCYGTGDNPLLSSDECGHPTGSFTDWGHNAIQRGDQLDPADTWRSLTSEEGNYLINSRALGLLQFGRVDTLAGIFLLPDQGCTYRFDWLNPNNLTIDQWKEIEKEGVIFLPCAGKCRYFQNSPMEVNSWGYYWLNDGLGSNVLLNFSISSAGVISSYHYLRYNVRLVRDAD